MGIQQQIATLRGIVNANNREHAVLINEHNAIVGDVAKLNEALNNVKKIVKLNSAVGHILRQKGIVTDEELQAAYNEAVEQDNKQDQVQPSEGQSDGDSSGDGEPQLLLDGSGDPASTD